MCVSTQTHTCPTSAHCSYRANHWPRTVVYVTAHTRSYVGHGLRVGVCLSIGVEGTLGGRADTHIHRCTRMQLCRLCVCVCIQRTLEGITDRTGHDNMLQTQTLPTSPANNGRTEGQLLGCLQDTLE